jgi:hypothetical protein
VKSIILRPPLEHRNNVGISQKSVQFHRKMQETEKKSHVGSLMLFENRGETLLTGCHDFFVQILVTPAEPNCVVCSD